MKIKIVQTSCRLLKGIMNESENGNPLFTSDSERSKVVPVYFTICVGSPIIDKEYLSKMDDINSLSRDGIKYDKVVNVNTVDECKKDYKDIFDSEIIEKNGPTTFYCYSTSLYKLCNYLKSKSEIVFLNFFNKYKSKKTKYHNHLKVVEMIAQSEFINDLMAKFDYSNYYEDKYFHHINQICIPEINDETKKDLQILIDFADKLNLSDLSICAKKLIFLSTTKEIGIIN